MSHKSRPKNKLSRYVLGNMRLFLASILTLIVVGTLGIFQRDVLLDTWNRLGQVSLLALIPLGIAASLMILARATFLVSCSPGLRLRQAIVADQSALAAGYGIVLGGGAVGTGMRIHMFTKWGISHRTTGSSIIATGVFPSFTTWGLPCILLMVPVLTGSARTEQTLTIVVGVPLIIISGIFWWAALRTSTVFLYAGRMMASVRSVLLRRMPRRFTSFRATVEGLQPLTFSIEMRNELIQLIKQRGLWILLASLGTLTAGFICLWTSVTIFKVEGLTFHEALVAFSLVRVVVALSPIPGGIGLAELGLITLLENAGVSVLEATGATLIYRLLTWFIPILVGTMCWWLYSRKDAAITSDSQHELSTNR